MPLVVSPVVVTLIFRNGPSPKFSRLVRVCEPPDVVGKLNVPDTVAQGAW
jgi:hypothetical protein